MGIVFLLTLNLPSCNIMATVSQPARSPEVNLSGNWFIMSVLLFILVSMIIGSCITRKIQSLTIQPDPLEHPGPCHDPILNTMPGPFLASIPVASYGSGTAFGGPRPSIDLERGDFMQESGLKSEFRGS